MRFSFQKGLYLVRFAGAHSDLRDVNICVTHRTETQFKLSRRLQVQTSRLQVQTPRLQVQNRQTDEACQELQTTARLAQSNLDLFRGAQESAQEELRKLQ